MSDEISQLLNNATITVSKAYNCVAKEAICTRRLPTKVVLKDKFVAIDTNTATHNNTGIGAGAGQKAAEKYDQYFDLKNNGLKELLDYLKKNPNVNYENFILVDHGSGNGIQIGNDYLTINNIEKFKDLLSQLGSYFPKDAYIHFWHCNAGDNPELIKKIAEYMGRGVMVSDSVNAPAYNEKAPWGDFKKYNPDGSEEKGHSKDLRDKKDTMVGDIFSGKTL
jgi:hypothetical protein